MAPALLKAFSAILDLLPIAYVIRIDTADAQVYQHRNTGVALPSDAAPRGVAPHAVSFEYR